MLQERFRWPIQNPWENNKKIDITVFADDPFDTLPPLNHVFGSPREIYTGNIDFYVVDDNVFTQADLGTTTVSKIQGLPQNNPL